MMKPDVTDVESLQAAEGAESSFKINHLLVPVLILETLVLLCLAVLAFYLRFTDEFPVFERAISCSDSSLKYPVYSSHPALFELQPQILYAVSFVLPPVMILLGETGFWLFSSKPRKTIRAHCSSCRINLTSRRLLRFIGTYLLGAFCVSILTDAIKLMIGRPRPYFFSVCDPQGIICSLNNNKMLNGTTACSSTFSQYSRIVRMSFPSFYASMSSYAAGYTMIYIHNILRMHGTYALRPLLVLLIGGLALVAGISRLMTYQNHWEDVLAGYVLGSTIAIYFGLFVMNTFKEHLPKRRPELCISRPEERSRFFRWFWIPRISFGKNGSRNYGVYSNGQVDKGPLEPNPAFQQDLHRRIENFGRKNFKSQNSEEEKNDDDDVVGRTNGEEVKCLEAQNDRHVETSD